MSVRLLIARLHEQGVSAYPDLRIIRSLSGLPVEAAIILEKPLSEAQLLASLRPLLTQKEPRLSVLQPGKGSAHHWENLPRTPLLRHIGAHAACLARKRARAFFPSLAASAMPSKKPGEHSTNPERPAR